MRHFKLHPHGLLHVMVTYSRQKPLVFGLPQIERIRESCVSDLTSSPPARIVAVGIRPPSRDDDGKPDDPPWSSLCALFRALPSRKEYWSPVAAERDAMTQFEFVGRDGRFCAFVDDLERSC
jgi:hypothetical protein